MEFHALRTFVEVVRQNGFSAAARVIFTTQSSVSKVIKQLEHEIGAPLFNRIGHRVTLTAVGDVVYRRGLRILAERDDLIAELGDLQGLKRGTLRLGISPINTSTLFAPVFALYRNQYPTIDIKLVEQGAEQLREQVLAGNVDVAVALLPVPDDFEWQEVTREPLVAVLPPQHPLIKSKAIDLTDLQHEPFILFETGYSISRVIMDACKRRGLQPIIAARSNQTEFVVALAMSGLGVGFLPRLIAEHRAVTYVPLAEPDQGARWLLVAVVAGVASWQSPHRTSGTSAECFRGLPRRHAQPTSVRRLAG
jgi:DNA-binding transcriptional LysR family regulator